MLPEAGADRVELREHAVVGEQAAVLLERMGVLERWLTRRGVADVGQERSRADLLGPVHEGFAAVRSHGLAPHTRRAVGLERAEADAVGLRLALEQEAVRRIDQPERRLHLVLSPAHP